MALRIPIHDADLLAHILDRQASGAALENVRKHSQKAPLTLFGSCFCPFVQRAWIALDYSEIDYEYYEVLLPSPASHVVRRI